MSKKYVAEALGTCLLLIAVVGSGIMAERLSDGNVAVALLANAIATGCALYMLISILGPVSGAHFNPAVTLAFWMRKEIAAGHAMAFVAVQIAGGIAGVWLAHVMFEEQILQIGTTARTGVGQWVAEVIAAFGLVLTILGGVRYRPEAIPALVALYITGAYWFTASTSFANPAVTIARSFTTTFAGIDPAHMPMFIGMQIIGAVSAVVTARWLFVSDPDTRK